MDGYYINLTHRVDRKNHMEKLKTEYKLFSNIERMEACYNVRGDIGVVFSHIKCLKKLKEFNEKYYLILEDDFQVLHNENFNDFECNFDKIKDLNWDVIVLTPRGDTIQTNYYENFHRINNNQTATGYIIKHEMLDIIEKLFNNGVNNLLKNNDPNIWALDQVWKPIQNEKIFLYYKDIFAGQMPGYSDIEKKMVNYNGRFLKQNMF